MVASLPILDKDKVASRLADSHFRIESGIRRIFRVRNSVSEADGAEPIKLLEVNEATIPSGILPVYFGPHEPAGISFPSIVIDVTPDEFERLKIHELVLPGGWELAEELPRPDPE
jgi:hypothetical protein